MTVTTYVPEKDKDKYTHSNIMYVDVIAKDVSGIEKVRIHVEENKYEFDDVSNTQGVFYIPKFTWS